VSFECEPVYVQRFLSPTKAIAASAGNIQKQKHGRIDHETRLLELTGPAWHYAALWLLQPITDGPAVVMLDLEVNGGDIGLLCTGADYSRVIGQELLLAPGTKARIELPVDRIEDVRALVIRKGPGHFDQTTVRFGTPEIFQAAVASAPTLPLSRNPACSHIPLAQIASGLRETDTCSAPDDRLEAVAAQDLGARLGIAAPDRPPRRIVDEPLSLFRMASHDAVILEQLYRSFRPARHLEFGTWEGFGTALCARACDAEIWTINLPEGQVDAEGKSVYPGLNEVRPTDAGENIGRLYREAGFAHRVHQLLMDSRDFDTSNFAPGFFDTVLVDGGHSKELVTNDTEKALAVLRSGGLMLWHDFCPDPEVIRGQDAAQGVVAALLANWKRWRPLMRDLVWVRPSWLLVGVKA
jgi:predicted O-methyltransferase YrrM